MPDKNRNSGRPNILFITSDQQRTDTIGAYGSSSVRTPNIDRLTGEGVVFERAYAQATVCIPSRACLQTGRYIHQHGVCYHENEIDLTPGLAPHEKTVMKHLRDAGYTTGAAGKIHMMPERDFDYMQIVGGKGSRWTRSEGLPIGPAPLGRQYADWLEERHPGGYEKIYEQRRRPEYSENKTAIVNCLPLEHYVETFILEKSIEFIRSNKNSPFFLWCGFCGPHGPFDPPAEYAGMYDIGKIELPKISLDEAKGRPPFIAGRADPDFRRKENGAGLRRLISCYYGLCSLIDDYVGKLVSVLEEEKLLDNTLIVYTSDHGEMLGDMDLYGKSNFYEPVVRVPLIVCLPGRNEPGRVEKPVELFDIAATFLNSAGLEKPREMSASGFFPLEKRQGNPHSSALSEFTSNDRQIHGSCLITEDYKYIYWSGGQGGEFYDLRQDPLEKNNLYYDPSYRAQRDEHAELLLERLMRTRPAAYTGRRVGHY